IASTTSKIKIIPIILGVVITLMCKKMLDVYVVGVVRFTDVAFVIKYFSKLSVDVISVIGSCFRE
ncbi:hypothetical protein, partial [Pseudomonas viridiflava]|uniref:hypothetical protein n=1 Tax=Pseudomonas viridiflava TaxID=33069 RepID=UPI0019D2D2DE